MDINYIFVWFVSLSCLMCLPYAVRSNNKGWICVSLSILVITLGLAYFIPRVAGWMGGSLWVIFFFLPLLGFAKMNKLVYQQRYTQARQLASWLYWLHPADGWLEQPQLLLALELGQRGEIGEASKIIERFPAASTTIARHAQILLYSMRADWKKCLLWMRENLPKNVLFNNNFLFTYYIRALGETGDLNGLLAEVDRAEKLWDGVVVNLYFIRMFAFAFCGQIEQVRQLFYGPLALYPETTRRFWLATAQMAAGNEQLARIQMLNLRMADDLILSNAIDWRLCYPLIQPEKVLTNYSQEILERLKVEFNLEVNYQKLLKKKPTYFTYGLIGLNLLFFAVEMVKGGSENLDTLYLLGGLVPSEVFSGQWWRLLSANFLHFGWVHLLTNMTGLYFLGRYVELNLGYWRYLFVYLVSGMGAMFTFSLLALHLGDTELILVGASAGIMGLVGVITFIFLRIWQLEKSRIAAKRFQFLVLILAVQFAFDIISPNVSFLSHLFGMILGFFISFMIM